MIPRRVYGLCPGDPTPRWWIQYGEFVEEHGGDRRRFRVLQIYPVAHGLNDPDLVAHINGTTNQTPVRRA